MDTTDQPNSICHVQPIQMYQLPAYEAMVSFKLLAGEAVFHHGTSSDGLIILTNYRLYLQAADNHHHVPLGLIETVEHKDLFYLHVWCKDARSYKCTFGNNETCLEWHDYIAKAAESPKQLEQIFAFYHFIWSKDKGGDEIDEKIRNLSLYNFDRQMFKSEMERMQFSGGPWRISEANINYKLCPTYPPYLIVPSSITDEKLESVAKFRSSRRIPVVVWRHSRNRAVIARCSQPEVGWLGWRSSEDEDLIKAISEACGFVDDGGDKESMLSHSPGSLHSDDSFQITNLNIKHKKFLIMDARSYTTAVANRARGGGCECPEYYPNCEIQFMNLANIHSIRKSFHTLRLLCTSQADQTNWFSQLENTRWLQHMSGLMKAAVVLATAVERDARPVIVHCSDGWDRTPQIIALAELLLDPFYRTIDGFRILIVREWLAFGHKFADRCGQSTGSEDQNERCPVFLQWLDCVHQLLIQFSCAFEFSQTYLVKLAQHVYSNLYGTFLCNTMQERMKTVNGKTFSVWEFLNSPRFRNHLYAPPGSSCGTKVLWPQCNVRDLQLWNEVYLGSWESNFNTDCGSGSCPGPPESSPSHMTKTRSYGDLINADVTICPLMRRSSDPSINVDKKLSVLIGGDAITTTQQQQENGGINHNNSVVVKKEDGDFLCSNDSDDNNECNRDCIYNNNLANDDDYDDNESATSSSTTMEEEAPTFKIDGFVVNNDSGVDKTNECIFLRDHLINGDKTECDDVDCTRITTKMTDDLLITPSNEYTNGNDSDAEASESKSEITICDPGTILDLHQKSIETSTDTLVSDSLNISSSPLEVNGFEKLQSPVCDDTTDGCSSGGCKQCAQNSKFIKANNAKKVSGSPLYSRTSSGSGWDNGLPQARTWQQIHPYNLGEDGLIPIRSSAQDRLWQILQEHKLKEEMLKSALRSYRLALNSRPTCCHRCCASDNGRNDETSDSESESSKSSASNSPQRLSSSTVEPGSVVESVDSAGEGQASAVESLRSDMSWEAVEESTLLDTNPTLWVPDHAVKRCTGCQTEFWVGKRKHHCRKCGKIFCASCSDNSTPLPSEQLFEPVRVCTGCYSKLRRDCGEVPDQCKHSNGQPTNSNPQQIAASSN